MPDQLIHLDQQLFFAVNHGLSNSFFDWLMPILRNKYTWVPLYLLICFLLLKNLGRTGLIVIAFAGLTFALTDTVSARLIKPLAGRPRPCNDLVIQREVNTLTGCGTGYSFPSSHASNHFGIAVFFILLFYRERRWIMPAGFIWAASICFAQVYVGVHYPFDVTAGAILGCLVGYLTSKLFLKLQANYGWKAGN